MRNQGFSDEVFDGRFVIGIADSWSELVPCNAHLRGVAEAVKRGIWQAGGFPLEFNTMSLGETLSYTRLYVEHVLQAHQGADFDFLVSCRGDAVGREAH
jgi:dihydroxyacid dehydratase/phosphogluconate dehydratase